MKRIVLLFTLHYIVSMCFAQQIALTKEQHLPLVGDSIVFSEIPHRNLVIPMGSDCVWDYSSLITDSSCLESNYCASSNDSSHFVHHFSHTHHQYELNTDTLLYVGFENTGISVKFVRKRGALVYPFAYGDSLYSEFSGVGNYFHKKTYPIEGKSLVRAAGWGKLILPECAFDSILLIHSKHTYKNHLDDSANVVEEFFQWYHLNYRYPLFEVARKYNSLHSNCPTLMYACYHIPLDESLVRNADDEVIKEDNKSVLFPEIDSILTDIHFYPNPVYDDLTISYRQKQNATIFFSLHHNSGLCVYQSPIRLQQVGEYTEYIPMSCLAIGAYVVYIHVDDKIVSDNVLKY